MNKIEKAIELLSSNSDSSELDASVLIDAKRELERALFDLKVKEERFNSEMVARQKSIDANNQLFAMKWALLEEETRRLAEDTKKAEMRKQFYDRVESYHQNDNAHYDNVVNAELFFKGVASPAALKKRYKDLIKIYHPDAQGGDKQIVQEINREYANLKHTMNE